MRGHLVDNQAPPESGCETRHHREENGRGVRCPMCTICRSTVDSGSLEACASCTCPLRGRAPVPPLALHGPKEACHQACACARPWATTPSRPAMPERLSAPRPSRTSGKRQSTAARTTLASKPRWQRGCSPMQRALGLRGSCELQRHSSSQEVVGRSNRGFLTASN